MIDYLQIRLELCCWLFTHIHIYKSIHKSAVVSVVLRRGGEEEKMKCTNWIYCWDSFYSWDSTHLQTVQQGVLNVFIHHVVDHFLWLHPINVLCLKQKTKTQKSVSFLHLKAWVVHFSLSRLIFGPNWPILSQLFSISFLCLRYMGQTCPSNRPGGSGTVYVLVLWKYNRYHHILVFWCGTRTLNLSQSLQFSLLPPPPLALLIRKGDVKALIIDVDERPADGGWG